MMMNRIQIAIKNTPHLIEESECPIVNAGLGLPKEALGSLHSNKDGSHGQLRREDLHEAVNYDERIFLKQSTTTRGSSRSSQLRRGELLETILQQSPIFPKELDTALDCHLILLQRFSRILIFLFSKNFIAFQSNRRIA